MGPEIAFMTPPTAAIVPEPPKAATPSTAQPESCYLFKRRLVITARSPLPLVMNKGEAEPVSLTTAPNEWVRKL